MVALPRVALLVLAAALLSSASAAGARGVLAAFLARPPVADAAATLRDEKLENCLRSARELDKTRAALDQQLEDVQRDTAAAMFLRYQNNMQLPLIDNADENAKADLGLRTARQDALAQQTKTAYQSYRKRESNYDTAAAEFRRGCAGSYSRAGLDAAKMKLQIK